MKIDINFVVPKVQVSFSKIPIGSVVEIVWFDTPDIDSSIFHSVHGVTIYFEGEKEINVIPETDEERLCFDYPMVRVSAGDNDSDRIYFIDNKLLLDIPGTFIYNRNFKHES